MAKPKKGKTRSDKRIITSEFNIFDVINFDDDYELRLISFCLAYNDLWHINKEMLARSSKKYASYRLYLLKNSVAQLREAYWLLHRSFLCDIKMSEKLTNIEGAYPLFENILKIVDGPDKDSFAFKVLAESRNLTWHYSFETNDKNSLKQVAKEMSVNNVLGKIVIGERFTNTYFEFADRLFTNMIVTLGAEYGLSQEEYFEKIIDLMEKVIELLYLIISDFLTCNLDIGW